MATVGHALIGLAGAVLMPDTTKRPPRRVALLWPGIMVLLACALDLVEWAEVWIDPLAPETPVAERHLALVLAGCAGLGLLVAVLTRTWRVAGVLLLVAVTASHVLLDTGTVRAMVARMGGAEPAYEETHEFALRIIFSELRLYGLIMVLAILAAASRAIPTRRTRRVSLVLAIVCVGAALGPSVWIWAPPYLAALLYGFGALHALARPIALLNLLFILPTAVLAIAHAEGARRLELATESFRNRDQPTAVRGFESALALRTRRGREAAYGRMGEAYEIMGDVAAAELNYRKAIAVAAKPGWYELLLARLCAKTAEADSPRMAEARAWYKRLRDSTESSAGLREKAARELAALESAAAGRTASSASRDTGNAD